MQIIIGVYLTIYGALFIADGVLSLLAVKSGKAILGSRVMPYLRAIQYVMGIYLISIMSLGISLIGSLTAGFVNNITIILSIFALAYIVQFGISRYKLRSYSMAITVMTRHEVKSIGQIISHMGDSYIERKYMSEMSEVESSIGGRKAKIKGAVVQMAVGVVMIITEVLLLIAPLVMM